MARTRNLAAPILYIRPDWIHISVISSQVRFADPAMAYNRIKYKNSQIRRLHTGLVSHKKSKTDEIITIQSNRAVYVCVTHGRLWAKKVHFFLPDNKELSEEQQQERDEQLKELEQDQNPPRNTKPMDFFDYRDNALYAEEVPVSAIAEEFGTPCYVYSRATLERHWHAFDQAFADKPHLICYAVKANSNLAVLNILARLGSGFDIVSVGELERVLAAGGLPEKVVFSGVGKTQ